MDLKFLASALDFTTLMSTDMSLNMLNMLIFLYNHFVINAGFALINALQVQCRKGMRFYPMGE
jgi:hypothetical protein